MPRLAWRVARDSRALLLCRLLSSLLGSLVLFLSATLFSYFLSKINPCDPFLLSSFPFLVPSPYITLSFFLAFLYPSTDI
jgi:ABC-type antimicrobial peptide transport system permease subunit